MEQDQEVTDLVENTEKAIQWITPHPAKLHAGEAAKRTRQMNFLKALAQCGMVSHACKAAGVNIQTEQKWRKTADPWYQQQFRNALQEYRDSIEMEVHNRAIVGEQVPIVGKVQTPLGPEDAIIGHKTVKSDLLLMFHAKRHIKEYKDDVQPEKDDKPVEVVSPMTRISIRLDMISERKQQGVEGIVNSGTVIDITPEPKKLEE